MTLPVERGLAKTFAGHIHWRACGDGPVVMVSHINQQSSAVMVELLQALAPHFRAVAIDYPSHGNSDHIDWQAAPPPPAPPPSTTPATAIPTISTGSPPSRTMRALSSTSCIRSRSNAPLPWARRW